MCSIITGAFALALCLAVDLTSAFFTVSDLSTHQPNGASSSDNYRIEFSVTSDNANSSLETVHCKATWADNVCATGSACVATSTNVPTPEWIPCDTSEYAFQLGPNFAIGNFNLALNQTTADGATQVSETRQFMNTTDAGTLPDYYVYHDLECMIDSDQDATSHASGDCAFPVDSTQGFGIEEYIYSCPSPTVANVTFDVFALTQWYDHVFVVGSIPELGNWDPYNAVALSSDLYTEYAVQWLGGRTAIPLQTTFEWKYIIWTANGTLVWERETCGNRVFTMTACYEVNAGGITNYWDDCSK